jgi:hypothetical protein
MIEVLHVEFTCESFVDVVAGGFIETENKDIVDVYSDKYVANCGVVYTQTARLL